MESHQSAGRQETQAPLTKTCQNCATAKVKCMRSQGAKTCVRCLRLGKECFYRQARRRFYGNKNDSRIEMLEARVNELLEKQTATEIHGSSQTSQSISELAESSLPLVDEDVSHSNAFARDTSFYTAGGHNFIDIVHQGIISTEKADEYLSNFNTNMISQFPFVIPSPHHTSDSLRQHHPFLFLAIMASASYHDMRLQRLLGRIMMRQITERFSSREVVTFDLLQGTLVFIAWSQYHPRPKRHTQLLSLAVALIADFRLDRPPETWMWQTGITFNPDAFGEKASTPRSSEKDRQRAVLGCFYLASTTAILQRKMSILPFSAHILRWAESLRFEPEYPTDRYVLFIIKLQKIWENINDLSITPESDLEHAQSPVRMHVKMLYGELKMFYDALPFPIEDLPLLESQYQCAKVFLDQIGLLSLTHPLKKTRQPINPWYLELLQAGLITASEFFNKFLRSSDDTIRAHNTSQISMTALFLIIATKMVVAATEQQSTNPVTAAILQDISMESTLDLMIQRISGMATEDIDKEGDRDAFHHYSFRIQGIREWYLRRPRFQSSMPEEPNLPEVQMIPTTNLTEPSQEQTRSQAYSMGHPGYLPDHNGMGFDVNMNQSMMDINQWLADPYQQLF